MATVRAGFDAELAFAATCPVGTTGVPFTWEGAASGNRAVWPGAVQDTGFSRAYPGGTAPLNYNATLTVDDPSER